MQQIARKKRLNLKRVQLHRGVTRILSEQNQMIREELNSFKCSRPCPESSKEEINVNDFNKTAANELRYWVIEHHISHRAVNDLLKILCTQGFNWLPKDSRTFMSTPNQTRIINIANGKLWYHGVGENLKRILSSINQDMNVSLNINIDGLPCFESSSAQFWPILVGVNGMIRITAIKKGQFFHVTFFLLFKSCQSFIHL